MTDDDLRYLQRHVGGPVPLEPGSVIVAVMVGHHDGDGYCVDSTAEEFLALTVQQYLCGVYVTVREPDGSERPGNDAYHMLVELRRRDLDGCDDDHRVAINLAEGRAVVLERGERCPEGYERLDTVSRRQLALTLLR